MTPHNGWWASSNQLRARREKGRPPTWKREFSSPLPSDSCYGSSRSLLGLQPASPCPGSPAVPLWPKGGPDSRGLAGPLASRRQAPDSRLRLGPGPLSIFAPTVPRGQGHIPGWTANSQPARDAGSALQGEEGRARDHGLCLCSGENARTLLSHTQQQPHRLGALLT